MGELQAKVLVRVRDRMPMIRTWIHQTVEMHASQARSPASYGFPRLGKFFPAEMMQASRVVEVPRVPTPPLALWGLPELEVLEGTLHEGLAYGQTYFLREDLAGDESRHCHELVHVLQWHHLGFAKYFRLYVWWLLEKDLVSHPMERMAEELRREFEAGEVPTNLTARVCRTLDDLVRYACV